MKFKIGDKVQVKMNPGQGWWAKKAGEYNGEIGIVARVSPGCSFPYHVGFPDGKEFPYIDEELILVKPLVAQDAEPVEEATTQMTLLQKDGTRRSVTFVRVSIELFRSYLYPAVQLPNGTLQPAHIVRVDDPVWLYVAPSGSHRLTDAKGFSHYIPAGWVHLWWKRKDGCPPFVR